jgi:iron complex outermembrane recepter protein
MDIRIVSLFLLLSCSVNAETINGVVRDAASNEILAGAVVSLKGTTVGVTTDFDGKFTLVTEATLPYTLIFSLMGYEQQEISVNDPSKSISISLKSKQIKLEDVNVTGRRISEKQKEAPLTIESLDLISIKESAQNSFYEALGTLKGVDLTSASLGFTIVNTRGFNSTSPVRSLQLIDGVDNQSPGLNFSLGNFLGCSDLDVLKVDMIAGASSAYFGPNAFNGVIDIHSRSPFVKPGLELEVKTGERELAQFILRWSQVLKNKKGVEKFAYKINAFYMQANDWEANNLSATPQSQSNNSNPGGYDAVNRYGDEYNSMFDASAIATLRPGLGIWYRTGYEEKDIVDYNTHNLKLNSTLHYRIKNKTEVILASSYGSGTTVYQGDNRYSLKDISFFQNRIEINKADKFFVRVYSTHEDAGKSYDAFTTGLLLQSYSKPDSKWAQDYINYYHNNFTNKVRQLPGFPQPGDYPTYTDYVNSINPWLLANFPDTLNLYHNQTRVYADNAITLTGVLPRFVPGSATYDSAFKSITSTLFSEGGSRFYDKSALYHAQSEYRFKSGFSDVVVGISGRMYRPDSKGTIFQDTGNVKIENNEFGGYVGFEKRMIKDRLKINLTTRVDKNENFNLLFSPALSGVYVFPGGNILRASFSSAIRNPTLSDQYLYYRVGRAILVGNLNGFDSLVTIPSLFEAMNHSNQTFLEYFNVKPIQPEEVKTVEIGTRLFLFKNLYLDAVAYHSWYTNFIGYKIGADVDVDNIGIFNINNIYRVATNSEDQVITRGFSAGLSYYFKKFYVLSGNYSYNVLDRLNSIDPLIPAFNTPENKFNISLTGRDIDAYIFKKINLRNAGFMVSFKWIQGFIYEGSPQFTGAVPGYNVLDAQFSYRFPKIHTTVKIGASNLLDNRKFTVYGGPVVGRLAYASVAVDLWK